MHPYRTLVVIPPALPERATGSLQLALGVLVTVSAIQLISAYLHAGPIAGQTLIGAGCLISGLVGLARAARRAP